MARHWGKNVKPALVVDLDGTLLRSDITHESLLRALLRSPFGVFWALFARPRGRAAMKQRIARLGQPKVDLLPYREEILSEIDAAKAVEREVALVSGSDQKLVEAVADHLGCFDHRAGSDGVTNLSGQAKADYLVARYGRGGYSYAGDAWHDIPVWAEGFEAITAAATPKLRGAVESVAARVRHVGARRQLWSVLATYMWQMRPYLWLRNFLVFLPIVVAGSIDVADWSRAVAAFAAMCLAAASVYTINDLVDLDIDRLHDRKRNRPLTCGDLPLWQGVIMALGLAATAAAISLLYTRPALLLVLIAYVGLSLAYMTWLKRRRWVDLGALGTLSMLRPIAGTAATGLAISPALVAAVGAGCLALAGCNRIVELLQAQRRERRQLLGRAYRVGDIVGIKGLSLAASVLCALLIGTYGLTPNSVTYPVQLTLMFFVAPVMLYWLGHMVWCARHGVMADDTAIFAIHDRVSLACGAGAFISLLVAIAI